MTDSREVQASLVCAFLAVLVCYGCEPRIFPADVTQQIDPGFEFSAWRNVPNQTPPTKVELGGRIVEAQTLQGTTTIVVIQLPVVKHPIYGPKQGKSKGEFVIRYQGVVDPGFLARGNRIMVVGTTAQTAKVPLEDVLRVLPAIEAACIHIWKTGNTDISDYASSAAGYAVLEEETFCVPSQKP